MSAKTSKSAIHLTGRMGDPGHACNAVAGWGVLSLHSDFCAKIIFKRLKREDSLLYFRN